MATETSLGELSIALDRDVFLRTLIRELAGVLEEVVGYDEAAGYISLVGQNIGEWINSEYKKELGAALLSRSQVAEVLVDLKARIEGDFSITEQSDEMIVLENGRCPFGDKVLGRRSMCMMTSNVFGLIASENLGYAKVTIDKSIAAGDDRCRVTVHLNPSAGAEGREYVRSG